MIRTEELIGYARQQLKRMRSNLEPAIHPGEVESVHRFRVASRRLREPLEILKPVARGSKLKNAGTALRKMRNVFRDVRDMDVHLIHIGKAGTCEILESADLAWLEGRLTSLRANALERAARKADKKDTPSRLKRIVRLLDTVEGDLKRDALSEDTLVALMHKRAEQMLEIEPGEESADLHDLRLRIKRFRYSAELHERLAGGELDEIIRAAKEMQDLLGEWNDYLVIVETLCALIQDRDLLARQTWRCLRLQKYALHWSESAEQRRHEAFERWPEFAQRVRAHLQGRRTNAEQRADDESRESAPTG